MRTSKYAIIGAAVLLMSAAPLLAAPIPGDLHQWGGHMGQENLPSGKDFVAVGVGYSHDVAARTDGTLKSWGDNVAGQVAYTPTDSGYTAVSAGWIWSMALNDPDGNGIGPIAAWGHDISGQVSGKPGGSNFRAISAGFSHGLAIQDDNLDGKGMLIGWGLNDFGQAQSHGADVYVAVSGGHRHTLALRYDGGLYCAGPSMGGLYDLGQVTETPTGTDFIAISAGSDYNLAIEDVDDDGKGTIVSWGADGSELFPVPSGDDFVEVLAGGGFGVAKRADGSLATWGFISGGGPPETGHNLVAMAAGSGSNQLLAIEDQATAPAADADGPYSIDIDLETKVTLDASGSTDVNNDIISYKWDLDDNGTYETLAYGNAVFDVSVAQLLALGLTPRALPYDISVRAYDGQNLTDTDEGTLQVTPEPATLSLVALGACLPLLRRRRR